MYNSVSSKFEAFIVGQVLGEPYEASLPSQIMTVTVTELSRGYWERYHTSKSWAWI